MTYREAMEYIEDSTKYGSVLGLENIEEMLRRLGNPQNDLLAIHIAGTNGKGSVLAFVSTMLMKAGRKVGRYISPTIFEYRERIQINGKYISKADLGRYLEQIKVVCEEMEKDDLPHPTPFEMETALAFLYFREKKCDVIVLETGLGGRLDATNVITNTKIAVITSISMDHMNFLGDTIEKIAKEKAGIIKNGCYVILAKQKDSVLELLKETVKEKGAMFRMANSEEATAIYYGLTKQTFSYKEFKKMEITLLGKHQVENAVIALEVINVLKEQGFVIKEEAIRKGLRETIWEGRFSVIAKKPYFVIDGAHNEAAAKKLAESISFYFTNKKIIYIMGVLKDKEYEKVISHTYEYAQHIITITPPQNERALHAYDLAQIASTYHNTVTVADSLAEAVEIAYLLSDKNSVIIAFGSLSYLGELSNIVKHKEQLKFIV